MDCPINSFCVRLEDGKLMVKFHDYQSAETYAKKYGVMVVKEKGADTWYAVPSGVNQITWVE